MKSDVFSSLRFQDAVVEESFRSHDCLATVPVARFCYLTGCGLWALFAVVDFLLARERLGALWLIRFGVGMPTLVFAWAATYSTVLQPSLKLIGVAVTLICGASIIAMTAVLESPLANSYYVGLILVIICSYIFAQLRFFQAVFSGIALLMVYEGVLIVYKGATISTVINNSAFVISTIYIGLIACFKLEQHRRIRFSDQRTIENDNQRLTHLASKLEYQSSHDALTDLLNRRQLAAMFDDAVSRFATKRETTAVVLIDVDDFKQINDRYGHDVGDEVLEQVADAIRRNVRVEDAAFRYGGDEFLILLPGRTAVGSAAVATRIAAAFREWAGAATTPTDTGVGVSIGVTEVVSSLDTLRNVMQLADTAMYEAKRRGKGRIVVQPRFRDAVPETRADSRDPRRLHSADRENQHPGDHTNRRRRRL